MSTKALINRKIVTIYGKPEEDQVASGMTSSIQDEGLYGMPVTLLEEARPGWVRIRTHYHYEGYVPTSSLYLLSEAESQHRAGTLHFVIQGHADILSQPKVQGIRLLTVTRGAIISVMPKVEAPEGWVKVKLNDGTIGYMKATFLKPYITHPSAVEEEQLRQNLVETAKLYLGVQYRWGGKSTEGIDCSGLCSMAYLLNGIIIFRDAKIKEGFPIRTISFNQRQKGDLLYFPGHIAMLISENEYIHATGRNGSSGVVINSLNRSHPLYRTDLEEQLHGVGSFFVRK